MKKLVVLMLSVVMVIAMAGCGSSGDTEANANINVIIEIDYPDESGVAETDGAGWVYEVNDEMVMDAADAHTVSEGDKISWEFTTWGDM